MSKGIKIGFNFVPIPQEIWDNNLDLSLAEFRLLGYLIRHQVMFGNDSTRLTDDEILHGRKRKGGERMDAGCGITGRNNLKRARQSLIERSWIEVEEDLSDKARPRRYYRVILQQSDSEVSKSDSIVSATDNELSAEDSRSYSNKIVDIRFGGEIPGGPARPAEQTKTQPPEQTTPATKQDLSPKRCHSVLKTALRLRSPSAQIYNYSSERDSEATSKILEIAAKRLPVSPESFVIHWCRWFVEKHLYEDDLTNRNRTSLRELAGTLAAFKQISPRYPLSPERLVEFAQHESRLACR